MDWRDILARGRPYWQPDQVSAASIARPATSWNTGLCDHHRSAWRRRRISDAGRLWLDQRGGVRHAKLMTLFPGPRRSGCSGQATRVVVEIKAGTWPAMSPLGGFLPSKGASGNGKILRRPTPTSLTATSPMRKSGASWSRSSPPDNVDSSCLFDSRGNSTKNQLRLTLGGAHASSVRHSNHRGTRPTL